MEEFLEKLEGDQRRFRKFLLSKGPRFKRQGEALARVKREGGDVFVAGEPPLDRLMFILAAQYLVHLDAQPLDLPRDRGGVRKLLKGMSDGDALLVFLYEGTDPRVIALMQGAREAGVTVIAIGGIGAKAAMRKLSNSRVGLPTRGIKTICEGVFVCARILARISRAAWQEAGVGIPRSSSRRGSTLGSVSSSDTESGALSQSGARDDPELDAGPDDLELDGEEFDADLASASLDDADLDEEGSVDLAADDFDDEELDGVDIDEELSGADLSGADLSDELDDEDLDDDYLEPASRGRSSSRGRKSSVRVPAGVSDDLLDSGVMDSVSAVDPTLDVDPLPVLRSSEPVGLGSEPSVNEGPSFGSGILVGSDVVSALPQHPPRPRPSSGSRRAGTTTASADPYALEDAFMADLEMPRRAGSSHSTDSTSGEGPRVSTRYTPGQCQIRWGRGGWPDDSAPPHELVTLSPRILEFFLNPDDAAASTLQRGDELWVNLQVPAFIEPVLVRGVLADISGISGGGGARGTRVVLKFRDSDPKVRQKIQRAADNIGLPA